MARVAITSISFVQTESLRETILENLDTRFNDEQCRVTDEEPASYSWPTLTALSWGWKT